MTDEERAKLNALFYQAIEGGVTKDMESILDEAIDDGELDADFVRDNEMAIAHLFDDGWFQCVGCGWTMPNEEQTENDTDELTCRECSPVEDEE